MPTTFGGRLRELRSKQDVTLKELANELGVSVVYISDIERGRRNPPSGENINKIAKFLSTSPTELLNYADRYRDRVELSLNTNSDTALALARQWDTISEEQAKEILNILKGDSDE